MPTREIYRSPNGDRWLLARDSVDGPVSVRHEPNPPSGGRAQTLGIGQFLRPGAAGPEHQALLHLIGSLVENENAEPM